MLESLLNDCHDEDSSQLSAKDIMKMFVDLIRICFKIRFLVGGKMRFREEYSKKVSMA
jgi:hypothetical protein